MKYVALVFFMLWMVNCKSRNVRGASGLADATPTAVLPAPSPDSKTVLTSSQVDYIAAAAVRVYDAFYVSGSGYIQTPADRKVPLLGEINICIAVSPSGRWSTLMALYYALYPGYTEGFFPNIRECFSYLVSPNTRHKIGGKKPNYLEAVEYCTFMPIDREGVAESGALTNWAKSLEDAPALIVDNVTNNKAVGPFAWVHRDQEDVFKFVMFSGICGIDTDSQQKTIDKIMELAPTLKSEVGALTANSCR